VVTMVDAVVVVSFGVVVGFVVVEGLRVVWLGCLQCWSSLSQMGLAPHLTSSGQSQ